jgi:nucleotide-binding universal stress UspA family protein
MKILATFDGSVLAESILPQLEMLSALPNAEFVLLRVGSLPHSRLMKEQGVPAVGAAPTVAGNTGMVVNLPRTGYAETKEQAVERVEAELHDYLHAIKQRLPAAVPCRQAVILDGHPQSAIVRFAIAEEPDLIVMTTHGHTGVVHARFGDVAESVVRSGVAPVLLVHPHEGTQSRPK